jgi:hypothetical protein
MTRRSKREIERILDDLEEGRTSSEGDPALTTAHRAAVQAALEYYYGNYDTAAGDLNGDPSERRAVFREAADHVEEPHATTLRELTDGRGST